MHNRAGFFACRFFVGLLMGGFIHDSILYLSYFYKKSEMPIRLALFWFTDQISGVLGSLIAYAVFHLAGRDGRQGWRWLFLNEAIISFTIGLATYLFLVPDPTQTKTWWNPKGYYTEREEKIIDNRVLRDDPSKSDMHNRQAITPKMLWQALTDYDLRLVYAIGLIFQIPGSPPKEYLSLTLKALGFNTFHTTLLGIPITVFGAINLLGITWVAEWTSLIAKSLTEQIDELTIRTAATLMKVANILVSWGKDSGRRGRSRDWRRTCAGLKMENILIQFWYVCISPSSSWNGGNGSLGI